MSTPRIHATKRKLATISAMLGLIVIAIEATAINGAMPAIVEQLGGREHFAWVFSAYLTASASVIPLGGRLADMYGRKPMHLIGMVTFLAGALAASQAQSMFGLVVARIIQGAGAGILTPLVTTVIADIYSVEERARVQGVFTGAWAAGNVLGPLLGGWIVARTSWRWLFASYVPFCLWSVLFLRLGYVETIRKLRPKIDWKGALLTITGTVALLLGLDRKIQLAKVHRGALLVAFVLLAYVLIQHLRRAKEPIVPLEAFSDEEVRMAVLGSLFSGAVMYSMAAYVPWWITHERMASVSISSAALMCMLLGWSVGSTFGVRAYIRFGLRRVVTFCYLVLCFALTLLVVLGTYCPSWIVVFGALFFVGLGLGPAASVCLVGAQMRVDSEKRGAITAAVHSARGLGGALSIALLSLLAMGAQPSLTRFMVLAMVILVGVILLNIKSSETISL